MVFLSKKRGLTDSLRGKALAAQVYGIRRGLSPKLLSMKPAKEFGH